MSPDIQLLIALAGSFILITLLRINAAMVFTSVCLGYVLVEFVAKDANSLIRFLAPDAGISQSSWQLLTLLAPVVLTCVMTVFSMHGKGKALFNLFPAAAASVLLVVIAVPLLTPGVRFVMRSTEVWFQIGRYQSIIIGAGALLSLLFFWLQRHHAKKAA